MDESMLASKMWLRSRLNEYYIVTKVKAVPSVAEILKDIWDISGMGLYRISFKLPGNPKGRATLVNVLEKYGYHVENEDGEMRVEWNEAIV